MAVNTDSCRISLTEGLVRRYKSAWEGPVESRGEVSASSNVENRFDICASDTLTLVRPEEGGAGYSFLMEALTIAKMEGGIMDAEMPWSFSACSAASFSNCSSVSARISAGQFIPRSRQRNTLAMVRSFRTQRAETNCTTNRMLWRTFRWFHSAAMARMITFAGRVEPGRTWGFRLTPRNSTRA
jgi:hypothetical protein